MVCLLLEINFEIQDKISFTNLCSRWEVAICVSNQGFQQISFVNSIATLKGGKHVDHVADMVVKTLTDSINKKDKTGMKISPKQIKDHMWIFIGCLIENPTFDSQSKETMPLVAKSFGSTCELSEKFKKESFDTVSLGLRESHFGRRRLSSQPSQITRTPRRTSSARSCIAGFPKESINVLVAGPHGGAPAGGQGDARARRTGGQRRIRRTAGAFSSINAGLLERTRKVARTAFRHLLRSPSTGSRPRLMKEPPATR